MEDVDVIRFPQENQEFKVLEEVATTHEGQIRILKVNFEGKTCILKLISKTFLTTEKQIEHVYNEKKALQTLKHTNIVKLIKTIKDEKNLGFVLNLMEDMYL